MSCSTPTHKPQPAYSKEVLAWLKKKPSASIRVVSGSHGQMLCDSMYDFEMMEIEQALLKCKIDCPSTILLLPNNEAWADYWWPLRGVAVIIDWSQRSIHDAHSFADFLLRVVKATNVFIVHPRTNEYLQVEYHKAVAA